MLDKFVQNANELKNLYTAGPSSLTSECLASLQPCFGRGDTEYDNIENFVLSELLLLSGQDHILRIQGSATLALEIALSNFCKGNILVVDTGYYSERIYNILSSISLSCPDSIYVDKVQHNFLSLTSSDYDWIIACYTETSIGFKIDIESIASFAKKLNAKLFLDATASIGLEDHHHLSNVCCFSSCKGLFGLTGASFIAYDSSIDITEPEYSHYLRISTHIDKKVTGPYHSILSLYGILKNYRKLRDRVIKWQSLFVDCFSDHLLYPIANQPVLCTATNSEVCYLQRNPIIYRPRSPSVRNVICHIGQVHLPLDSITTDLIFQHFSISDS